MPVIPLPSPIPASIDQWSSVGELQRVRFENDHPQAKIDDPTAGGADTVTIQYKNGNHSTHGAVIFDNVNKAITVIAADGGNNVYQSIYTYSSTSGWQLEKKISTDHGKHWQSTSVQLISDNGIIHFSYRYKTSVKDSVNLNVGDGSGKTSINFVANIDKTFGVYINNSKSGTLTSVQATGEQGTKGIIKVYRSYNDYTDIFGIKIPGRVVSNEELKPAKKT